MYKNEKIDYIYIIIAFIILLLGSVLVFKTKIKTVNEYSNLQLQAAIIMEKSETFITEYIIKNEIEFEVEDINNIGLIGPEWSELTTTPGNVDAKRTSLNPNFAALIVHYFIQADIKEGDTIAIGSSGSFPALLIATLSACKVMNIKANIIISFGSSMHGATRPDFNIATIVNILKKEGFFDFNLIAVSPGGKNDYGVGVLEEILYSGTRDTVLTLCTQQNVEIIDFNDIEKSIQRRLELFGVDTSMFVNIGGASANLGTSAYTLDFPQGLVMSAPRIPISKTRGLTYEYATKGIPVLNLLNVRKLASENGLAYDPVPLSKAGEGDVYFTFVYNKILIIFTIFFSILTILFGYISKKISNRNSSNS
jgi:poly-gamma-glutamate system protein